jgi:hypothetical protein
MTTVLTIISDMDPHMISPDSGWFRNDLVGLESATM